MIIKNKLFNFTHGVKRVRTKGARNVGKYFCKRREEWLVCKYDWKKPFSFISKKHEFKR